MICLKNVSFSYGKQSFIEGLSCELPDGRITGLLGANGSGKSTIMRLCAGLLRPNAGRIDIDGRGIRDFSPKELAREAAFLPQARPVPALSVRTLAANGRFPYLGITRKLSREDETAVDRALEITGLRGMADRELRTLSGGERQKAYMAMLIAQEARHMLLDEPTTYLDVGHQLELMELMGKMKKLGRCVVMVMHDIDLAMQYCDDVLVVKDGSIIYGGPAETLAYSGAIEAAYGVRAMANSGMRFARI